jgi:5,10-methylenetetrahydrofolate reductase
MTKVNTLFGSFDVVQLKQLKGYIEEVVLHMQRNDSNNQAIKDIIEVSNEELKIPKKIIKRMAKTQFKNSFQTEVAESKEFEALFESMNDIK